MLFCQDAGQSQSAVPFQKRRDGLRKTPALDPHITYEVEACLLRLSRLLGGCRLFVERPQSHLCLRHGRHPEVFLPFPQLVTEIEIEVHGARAVNLEEVHDRRAENAERFRMNEP